MYLNRHFPFIHKRKLEPRVLRGMSRSRRIIIYILLAFLCILIVSVVGLIFVLGTYAVYADDLVTKERLLNRHFRGLIIYDKDKNSIYESDGAHEVGTAKITDVPRHMKNATLAIEDAQFYEHPGFSWGSMLRSVSLNVKNNSLYAYGGSTITQQLVKNSLLDDRSKSYTRKFKEIVLAVGVDKRYTKDQVLEMYLNASYYGKGAYGIGEASVIYFGIPVENLSLAQSAFLAGLPNAPSVLSTNFDRATKRQQYVLTRMHEEKFITDTDFEEAKSEKITLAQEQLVTGKYPHFSLFIKQQIIERYGEGSLDRSGYRVYTTLDSRVQDLSQSAVSKQVAALVNEKVTNGAAIVMDPKTGAIKAMVGSSDWNNNVIDGKVNITLSAQQPGSSFKPLIYLRGLDKGVITTATRLNDSPKTFQGDFNPKNYDGKFRGKVTVRRALANSLNLPAVEVMEKVGLVDGVNFSKSLGVKSLGDPSNYGLSLVLGGAEVNLIEQTTAFATLSNTGIYNEAYSIDRIVDKYGQTIFNHDHRPARVANENAVFIITDILADNNARQEIFGPSSLKLSSGRPAAVKTGTTNDYRDAWTIGYTPTLVAGVWVGNNDNTSMNSVAGSLGAAPIWKDIVDGTLKNTVVEKFSRPDGVAEGETCELVEKKVVDNGTEKKFYEFISTKEVFIKGSVDQNCGSIRKELNDGKNPDQIKEIDSSKQTKRDLIRERNNLALDNSNYSINMPKPTFVDFEEVRQYFTGRNKNKRD